MPPATTYEIVVRGRANARLLRPLLDDFTVDHTTPGLTRLVGEINDAAHLNGVLAHLTSVNTDVVSISPLPATPPAPPSSPNQPSPHPGAQP